MIVKFKTGLAEFAGFENRMLRDASIKIRPSRVGLVFASLIL
jgi:hypothetical protein